MEWWGRSFQFGDPYRANRALVLHADGANGSTTFTDSSPAPKTITSFGGAAISTDQARFGTGSARFRGSGTGDYLTASNVGNFGSGDFTVEAWVYPISRTTTFPTVFGNYSSFGAGSLGLFAGHNSGNTTKYQVACNGTFPAIQSTTDIVYNAWSHLALVRSGSTLTLYINKIASGTFTTSATLNGTSGLLYIGAPGDNIASGVINAYIDELIVTSGVALTPAQFTYDDQVPDF